MRVPARRVRAEAVARARGVIRAMPASCRVVAGARALQAAVAPREVAVRVRDAELAMRVPTATGAVRVRVAWRAARAMRAPREGLAARAVVRPRADPVRRAVR